MNKKLITVCLFLIICTSKSSVMSLWDFAATAENKIIFFDKNWNELSAAAHQFTKLSGLAFDEIEEKLYFSDQYHNNGSIFSLKLPNNVINGEAKIEIVEKIVARINNETIGGITFDPYDRMLYWTDKSHRKIYRIYTTTSFSSSNNNQTNNNEPKIFLNLNNDSIPEGITIDICNRVLYWTDSNIKNPSIQRIFLDSESNNDQYHRMSEKIIDKELFQPRGIIVDYYSKRLFWVVNLPGIHYVIESSNLDGSDRKTIYKGLHTEPFDLTVTKDLIYWTDLTNEAIWNLSKSAGTEEIPHKVYNFTDKPRGILSRFGLLTKLTNVSECKNVISSIKMKLKNQISNRLTSRNNTSTMRSIHIAKPHVYCLNGGEYNPLSDACICKIGYSGLRCEQNDCTNYCVHGTCEISNMGFPECICNEGFYGIRCEAFKCSDYCLNGGYCEILNNKANCECSENYTGQRCEQNLNDTCTLFCTILKYNPNYKDVPTKCHNLCIEMNKSNVTETNLHEISQNLNNNKQQKLSYHQQQQEQQQYNSNISLDNINTNCNSTYPIIIICLSVLLAFTIVLLIILIIKKSFKPPRPKIRKTFVVQKRINGNYKNNSSLTNGTYNSGNNYDGNTPLTSRPLSGVEKCEITIENCCNMNICDTPCFDPKVLQQSFEDSCSKNSKDDDKKILVDNMEEDLY